MTDYVVIDVETVPLDLDAYFETDEADRTRYLNPIDSKIIAAGLRSDGTNEVFFGENEARILEDFWAAWEAITRGRKQFPVVGFNIADFDMPMLTGRSFQNGVAVRRFTLKDLIDLRERLSAFQWRPKGTLHDYVESIGIEPETGSGANVAGWYRDGKLATIESHLKEDLEITDELYQVANELNVTEIERW